MRVAKVCSRHVVTCSMGTSAQEMARLMREHHVGDVVVVDLQRGRPVPVGIVTDRDLVMEVVATGLEPAVPTAGDLLRGTLATASISDSLEDALVQMRTCGVQRLPVVDARGELVGMLTAEDATRALAEALAEIARIGPRQRDRELRQLSPVK